MRKQFSDIQASQAGKTGFVLGTGPSLKNHLEDLHAIDQDKDHFKIVSCNNIDRLTDLNFDYWVLAQPADDGSPFNIVNAAARYNSRPKTTLLYTDCLDLTPRSTVDNLLSIDFIGYDQRHFNSQHCTWGKGPGGKHICCEGIIPGRLCIQEEFLKVTKYHRSYGCGDTVAVHMLATAVILGLNPIYVTGIDLDYTNGYVNNDLPDTDERTKMGLSSINNSPDMVQRIFRDFETIRDAAASIGVQIYCMDEGLSISKIFPVKNFSANPNANTQGITDGHPFLTGIQAKERNNEPALEREYSSRPENKEPYSKKLDNGQWEVFDGKTTIGPMSKKAYQKYCDFKKELGEKVPPVQLFEGGVIPADTTGSIIGNPPFESTTGTVDANNIPPDTQMTYTGKIKPDDEYLWEYYPEEYAAQLVDIKNNDHQDFFISNFDVISNPENVKQTEVIFRDNLHDNWKEIYQAAHLLQPKSIYEVGFGAGYHLYNLHKLLPDAVITGCDLLQKQLEKTREFSALPEDIVGSLHVRDITKGIPIATQYEFVFAHTVIMHLSTEHAVAAMKNMAMLSSKWIFLVEGVANHDKWYDLVQSALPDWDFEMSTRYIPNGILLTKKNLASFPPKHGPNDASGNEEVKPNAKTDYVSTATAAVPVNIAPSPQNTQEADQALDLSKVQPSADRIAPKEDTTDHFIFTEIIGCAEVGRVALETFFKFHPGQIVHVFASMADVEQVEGISDNIRFIAAESFPGLLDKYKTGHEGTAYVFAKVFGTGDITKKDKIIHFDSDVVFKKECLSLLTDAMNKEIDIIGSRRCYVNNPANIPVKEGVKDTVSTYFYGFKKSFMPVDYSFEQICQMFSGANLGLDHDVFDFGDSITFHAINNGARIAYISSDAIGGQNKKGSKQSAFRSNLHLDAGSHLVHFGGAGSGCVAYKEPKGKNESYARWAVVRYSLFAKLLLNKDIHVDGGETKYDSNGRWVSGNYDKKILNTIKQDLA